MFTILIIGQELEKCERLKYLLQDIRTDLKAYCVTSYTKALNYISHYAYHLFKKLGALVMHRSLRFLPTQRQRKK